MSFASATSQRTGFGLGMRLTCRVVVVKLRNFRVCEPIPGVAQH